MTALLVLGLGLAILAALAIGVVVAFVKAPRTMLALSAVLALGMVSAWELMLLAHHLGHPPGALDVTRRLYVSEESWGFGPGGNEAGFLAYALPESTARQIDVEGLAWFDRLRDGRRGEGWRGRFGDWQRTPVVADGRWQPDPSSGRMEVLDYVCAYGFCIDIDQGQLRAAEDAVNSPGSYYAHGRIGLILIVPRTRRVYFLYNG